MELADFLNQETLTYIIGSTTVFCSLANLYVFRNEIFGQRSEKETDINYNKEINYERERIYY